MTDAPDDPRGYRRLTDEIRRAVRALRRAVLDDPDRDRAYREAEEARVMLRDESGAFADAKGDVLLAAAEERGAGPASMSELAGGVTTQRTSRMMKDARARRASAEQREEPA